MTEVGGTTKDLNLHMDTVSCGRGDELEDFAGEAEAETVMKGLSATFVGHHDTDGHADECHKGVGGLGHAGNDGHVVIKDPNLAQDAASKTGLVASVAWGRLKQREDCLENIGLSSFGDELSYDGNSKYQVAAAGAASSERAEPAVVAKQLVGVKRAVATTIESTGGSKSARISAEYVSRDNVGCDHVGRVVTAPTVHATVSTAASAALGAHRSEFTNGSTANVAGGGNRRSNASESMLIETAGNGDFQESVSRPAASSVLPLSGSQLATMATGKNVLAGDIPREAVTAMAVSKEAYMERTLPP